MKFYKKEALKSMTTYQLREISFKEKITLANIRNLSRRELINTIMEYRGIDENLFIEKYDPVSFEALSKFSKSANKKELTDKKISYPKEIILYEGLELDYFYKYEIKSNSSLEEVNVLLVDEDFNLCTVFNLVNINNKYYLTKNRDMEVQSHENHRYSLIYLPKKYSEMIFNVYNNNLSKHTTIIEFYRLPILNFSINKLRESKEPLVIDIGNNNSTMGTYKVNENSLQHEENFMKIIEVLRGKKDSFETTPIIPTAAAVKSIKGDKIEYVFGYDAIDIYQKKDKLKKVNVFFNIKRWLNNIEKYEEVVDEKGKKIKIQRKDIFKAYLQYLIDRAQQYFKCRFKKINIVFSTKEKERYPKIIKKLLDGYEMDATNFIDESSAAILNNIWKLIDNKVYEENKTYEALIIDCGSRKTELNACEFEIRNNRISYEVDINSYFRNGEINFGGDNITFRILQFLKIIIAKNIDSSGFKDEIIPCFHKDIFRIVDENDISFVYKDLEEDYERAEEIIPTKFNKYKVKNLEDHVKIKRNYYYLFHLAQEIKKEFFKQDNIYEKILTFKEADLKEKIKINRWKIHCFHNGELVSLKELDDIKITRYEIEALLKADIYNIIETFLKEIYEDGSIFKYSLIKLTGQSLYINIFDDAIKEFVPGKTIQFKKDYREYDLKMNCLKGILRYLYLKDLGFVNFNIKSKVLKIPYEISGFNHRNEEKILIQSLSEEKKSKSISRFMEKEIALKLYMKNPNNEIVREFIYNSSIDDYEKITEKEIEKKYDNIIFQFETDNISNNEIKFFIWQEKAMWGFGVVPIARKEDDLFIGPEKFYSFEDDSWEIDFFDGLK